MLPQNPMMPPNSMMMDGYMNPGGPMPLNMPPTPHHLIKPKIEEPLKYQSLTPPIFTV